MIGTTNSVVAVAPSSPPITARPSGAFCSPPSPRPSAIGSMPRIMAAAVISTGRSRANPADSIASRAGGTDARSSFANVTEQDAVRGRHANRHDRAHQRRHAQRRPGDEQRPEDAGHRARQRREDDERIEPRLKVHGHQQVDEHHGERRSPARAGETTTASCRHSPRRTSVVPRGRFGRSSATIVVDRLADRYRGRGDRRWRRRRRPAPRCSD